jgi:hypothetical protein
MANKTRTILKGYFETGEKPTETQYIDLIDSNVNIEDLNLQTLKGPLSSSHLHSNDLTSLGTLSSNILTSNNISSTGDITTEGGNLIGNKINTGQGNHECYAMNQDVETSDAVSFLNITTTSFAHIGTHVSASDVWVGGGATASLHTSASLSEVIFENLPTTKPTITGSLWLSGSAGSNSQYLVVFTG